MTEGYFTQSYGSDELDASLLLLPTLGFLPADDERIRATVMAIADRLQRRRLRLSLPPRGDRRRTRRDSPRGVSPRARSGSCRRSSRSANSIALAASARSWWARRARSASTARRSIRRRPATSGTSPRRSRIWLSSMHSWTSSTPNSARPARRSDRRVRRVGGTPSGMSDRPGVSDLSRIRHELCHVWRLSSSPRPPDPEILRDSQEESMSSNTDAH